MNHTILPEFRDTISYLNHSFGFISIGISICDISKIYLLIALGLRVAFAVNDDIIFETELVN